MCDIIEVLDNLRYNQICCSICQCWLSAPPVFLNDHGENVCATCSRSVNGKLVRNIHYEYLANGFIFPCKFHKEGCSMKEFFGSIHFHEKKCPFQAVKCPVKHCDWSGITSELIIHFNLEHTELKISNQIGKELLNGDGCFLLLANGFHFVINWNFIYSYLKIHITNLNFTSSDVKVECSLTATQLGKTVKLSTFVNIQNDAIFDLYEMQSAPSKTLLLSVNAFLLAEDVAKRLEILEKIRCPCCHLLMAPPILKCPKGHITCLECTRADFDLCGQCVEDNIHFTRVRDLEMITIPTIYTCKWDGCGKNFSYKQIREHEQSCSKRTFMCMHCFEWYGFLPDMNFHDLVCKSKKMDCPLIMSSEVTILEIKSGMQDYLLIAFNEIFWVNCKFISSGANVSVSNYGPISCLNWYQYEAHLLHTEFSDSPLNKKFDINNKSYNEYTAHIPLGDLAVFDEPQYYKIIVKIILLKEEDRCKNANFIDIGEERSCDNFMY